MYAELGLRAGKGDVQARLKGPCALRETSLASSTEGESLWKLEPHHYRPCLLWRLAVPYKISLEVLPVLQRDKSSLLRW